MHFIRISASCGRSRVTDTWVIRGKGTQKKAPGADFGGPAPGEP